MVIDFVLFSFSNPAFEAVLQKFIPMQKNNYYIQAQFTTMDYLNRLLEITRQHIVTQDYLWGKIDLCGIG